MNSSLYPAMNNIIFSTNGIQCLLQNLKPGKAAVNKLLHYGIQNFTLKWLSAWVTGRTQKVANGRKCIIK